MHSNPFLKFDRGIVEVVSMRKFELLMLSGHILI